MVVPINLSLRMEIVAAAVGTSTGSVFNAVLSAPAGSTKSSYHRY